MNYILKLLLVAFDKLAIVLILFIAKELLKLFAVVLYSIARHLGERISKKAGIIYSLYQLAEDIRPRYDSYKQLLERRYIRLSENSNFVHKLWLKKTYQIKMIRFLLFHLFDFCKATYILTREYICDKFRLHNELRKLLFSTKSKVVFATKLCVFRINTAYKFSFQVLVNGEGKILEVEPNGQMFLGWSQIERDLNIDDLLIMDYHNHSSVRHSRINNSSLFVLETGKLMMSQSNPSVLIIACPIFAENNFCYWSYLIIPINHNVHFLYRTYSILWRFWCWINYYRSR